MPDGQAILVTRPEPEAEAFADQFRKIEGVAVFKAPMTIVRAIASELDWPEAEALLITSPRAIEHTATLPDRPAYVVGPATARAAETAGLKVAGVADGQADDSLVSLVPAGTKLLHLAGAHTSRDLKGPFQARGITLRRQVVYEAVAAKAWPSQASDFLTFDGPKSVTFLSARATEIFADGVPDDAARARLQQTRALCASARIAAAATGAKLFLSVKNLGAPDASCFVDFVSPGCT